MASYVRVLQTVSVVLDPGGGKAAKFITLGAGERYDSDDPMVQAYPWAFESDMEDASAAPGERRGARR